MPAATSNSVRVDKKFHEVGDQLVQNRAALSFCRPVDFQALLSHCASSHSSPVQLCGTFFTECANKYYSGVSPWLLRAKCRRNRHWGDILRRRVRRHTGLTGNESK